MAGDSDILIVRNRLWLPAMCLLITFGPVHRLLYPPSQEIIARAGESSELKILASGILLFLIFLFTLFSRIVFTPEGHQFYLASSWNGRLKKVFFKSAFRKWKDCVVELDVGAPFYALNILQTSFHLPLLNKLTIKEYDAACGFILKYGRAANISPKALAHLERIGGKKSGWNSLY